MEETYGSYMQKSIADFLKENPLSSRKDAYNYSRAQWAKLHKEKRYEGMDVEVNEGDVDELYVEIYVPRIVFLERKSLELQNGGMTREMANIVAAKAWNDLPTGTVHTEQYEDSIFYIREDTAVHGAIIPKLSYNEFMRRRSDELKVLRPDIDYSSRFKIAAEEWKHYLATGVLPEMKRIGDPIYPCSLQRRR